MNISNKEAARALYQERLKNGAFWNKKEHAAFIRRVRKLAKKVSIKSQAIDEIHAVMYLDVIATRENIWLKFNESDQVQES